MEETIIIGDLQVWPRDLGEMTWRQATARVAELGPGWRLPTIEEFKETLYPNRSRISGVDENAYYWSSTEYDFNYAWYFTFYNGTASNLNNYYSNYVRAVRDFTGDTALEYLLKDF